MSAAKKKGVGEELPPKIPETLPELEHAIMLLGNRWQRELNPKPRAVLVELIGCYPSKAQAAAWKTMLRGVREEMLAMGESSGA